MKKSEKIKLEIQLLQIDFEKKMDAKNIEFKKALEEEKKTEVAFPILKMVRKYHSEGSEIYKKVSALEQWAYRHGYKGYHNSKRK